MKVQISAQARADLFEIEAYIARDNPRRAVSFVEELIERIGLLGERPLSFPNWTDRLPDLRVSHYRRYRIVFRVARDMVSVERVLHGARNMDVFIDDLE